MNKTMLTLAIAAVTASAWAESVDVRTRPHFDKTFNSYKDAFVYKVYLKSKGTAPETTIDQVRDIIRLTHDVSGGMHQIVYLVGWQYDGHDSKYPAWHETGAHCASSLSDDPRESIRKLMRESRQYNADVSFHINMNDAYTSSPLWKTYEEKDLLRRMEDGSVYVGDDWGGERCRIISHVREWESGLAQKRILDLLELYPELRNGGTIHIDALWACDSPFHKITKDDDLAAINRIIDFWHAQGVDVTTEFLWDFRQAGYYPMVYHIDIEERQMLELTPDIVCGGSSSRSLRHPDGIYRRPRLEPITGIGVLYPEAWGQSHWGDLKGSTLADKTAFVTNFMTRVARFAYFNRSRPVRNVMDAETYSVERANGVVASVRMKDRSLTVTDNGRLVVTDGDQLLDFPTAGGTLLAYSQKGCDRIFALPKAFAACRELVGKTYPDGKDCRFETVDGMLRLKLPPATAAVLRIPAR